MFDMGKVGVSLVSGFFPSYPVAISHYEQMAYSFPQVLAESQEHAAHPTENGILVFFSFEIVRHKFIFGQICIIHHLQYSDTQWNRILCDILTTN